MFWILLGSSRVSAAHTDRAAAAGSGQVGPSALKTLARKTMAVQKCENLRV